MSKGEGQKSALAGYQALLKDCPIVGYADEAVLQKAEILCFAYQRNPALNAYHERDSFRTLLLARLASHWFGGRSGRRGPNGYSAKHKRPSTLTCPGRPPLDLISLINPFR